jgi:serine protease Do
MHRRYYGLPAALVGSVIIILQPPATFALSSAEVSNAAEQVTVLIDGQSPGSGVIIRREGNTYTVLTARHVVETKDSTILSPRMVRNTHSTTTRSNPYLG